MLASLNTMVNTSAKIAKSFFGLSTMNIAIRRHVIFLHLEAKYAKKKKKKKGLQK